MPRPNGGVGEGAGSERDSSRAGDYRRPSARRQEMGNIERCWLLRDSRPLRATADESEATRLPGIGVAVVGPFVPETTLRGAVEEIVGAIKRAYELLIDPEGADVLRALGVLEAVLPESSDDAGGR
jgi:hypothetical protein